MIGLLGPQFRLGGAGGFALPARRDVVSLSGAPLGCGWRLHVVALKTAFGSAPTASRARGRARA